MKNLTTALKVLNVIAAIVCFGGADVFAFHNGGVGPCDGCHTMHNYFQGQSGATAPGLRLYLLKEQDISSTCLNCHQQAGDSGPVAYHISTPVSELTQGVPPRQLSPGGDFGWLNKTYSWSPGLNLPVASSRGERHGHNIVAVDFLYTEDSTHLSAPGGSYPSNRLGCTSCHDPHGKYRRSADGSISTGGAPIAASGSSSSSPDPDWNKAVGVYRLLGGKNYQSKSVVGNYAFMYDPPAAVAPATDNRSEAVTQTRVAYGSGMSEWCRNCHADMHTTMYPGDSNMIHPAGNTAKLGYTISDNYNKYIKTGDLTGIPESSFLSLVPFEEGTVDYAVLKSHARDDDSHLAGPDRTTAQAMCLTCHRAHASGWDGMTRWNTGTEYIVYNGHYAQEGQIYQPYGQGRTEAESVRAYYDRSANKFGLNQDTLCNKCHIASNP